MQGDRRPGEEPPVDPASPTATTILRSISWLGAGHLVNVVSWWGSLIVLAALLPPTAFGTVAIATVIIQTAVLVMGSGSRGSLIANRALTGDQFRGTIAINVVTGLVLAGAICLLAGPITDLFAEGGDPDVIRVLSLSLLATALSIAPLAFLEKKLLFKRYAAVSVASSAISAVVAVVAVLAGLGVWALVLRLVLLQALVALFAWVAVRGLAPRTEDATGARELVRTKRPDAMWFMLLAVTNFVALSFDNLVVGGVTDAEQLGLYTLAFTLGFAPLTQFSWRIGQVLFPAAAATQEPEVVAKRTLKATRVTSLLLLPLLAPALVLAPVLLPAILGSEWTDMVVPFQLLMASGIIHAVVNVIGESLSGTGHIAFRARVNVVWALGTIAAVFGLAQFDGIRGAALAHLLLILPLAAVYLTEGVRRIGAGIADLSAAVGGIVVAVAVQGATTWSLAAALGEAGLAAGVSAALAAVTGLLVGGALLHRGGTSPLREGRALVSAALGKATP